MIDDLRAGLRSLVSRPHIAVVAVLSVGLGLGVNLTLFGVLRGFYVQERELPAGDRLLWVAFLDMGPDGTRVQPPPRRFLPLLSGGGAWEAAGGWDGQLAATVVGDRTSYGSWVRRTTPGLERLQGLVPAAGRFFEAADTVPGAAPVAVLAHGLAVSAYGSAAGALGRGVRVEDEERTVVGVLPPTWDAGEFPIHVPLGGAEGPDGTEPVRVVVRLRPGVSRERARAELEARAAQLGTSAVSRPAGLRTGSEKEVLRPAGTAKQSAPPLLLAATILLAAAANLATVLLARGLERRRDIAIRRLLGAGRWALLRPLVLESTLVAAGAVTLGLLLAWITFRTVLGSIPGPDTPRVSLPLLIYGMGLASMVVLCGGCWPAFVSGRVDATEALRSGGRAVAGRGVGKAMRVALALQVAVAMPLVLVAGSLANEALREGMGTLGFDPSGLVHVEIPPAALGGGNPRMIVERAALEPGLVDVAAATVLPITNPGDVEVDRGAHQLRGEPPPRSLRIVRMTGDPLGLLRIPLLAGRGITSEEAWEEAPVALVSERAAQALFPEPSAVTSPAGALGRRLRVRGDLGAPWLTVVGVVGDVRDQPLFQDEAPPAVWVVSPLPAPAATTVWARPQPGEAAGPRALREAVRAATGLEAPSAVVTAEWARSQTAATRFASGGTAAAAAVGVLLCLLGLHGLTALSVVHRYAELGVRSALGASGARLVTAVLGGVAAPVVAGVAVGTLLWALVGHVVLVDPPAIPGVTAAGAAFLTFLCGTALRPALRAAAADPGEALRS